jgi:hypothetical protein
MQPGGAPAHHLRSCESRRDYRARSLEAANSLCLVQAGQVSDTSPASAETLAAGTVSCNNLSDRLNVTAERFGDSCGAMIVP